MNDKYKKYEYILFLCLLYPIFISANQSDEPSLNTPAKVPIIESIEIIGLDKVNKETVLSKLQSKAGLPFSSNTLEEDIRRLYETNLFSKIDWKTEEIVPGEKVKIVFTVVESGVVQEVFFDGAKKLSESTLKQDLKIKPGSPLNNFLVESDIRTITEKYLDNGYYFAEVNYRIDDGIKGKIVTYIVREGPEVKIKDITLKGNKSFPVITFGKKLLSFSLKKLFSRHILYGQMKQTSGVYREKDLILDVERLKNFYRNKGWLDVEVFVEDMVFNDTKNKIFITLHINEGPPYKIGKLSVTDNKIISTSKISSNIKVKKGAMYEMETILRDVNAIKTLYGKLGYIDCNVEIKTHFPLQPAIVDLTYKIIEGTPGYLEKIKITGNDKTRDKVIRREMTIYPGDLMDYGLIRESLDRIASTQYFKTLNFEIEDGSLVNRKDILINLTEGQTGMMNFGGGYSSNLGFTGIIEYRQANFDLANPPKSVGGFFTSKSFAGGGQLLTLRWQPGVQASQFGIYFTEPYVFNYPVELDFNMFSYERFWFDYQEERDGGGFTLARRFKEKWKLGIGPSFEQIQISSIKTTAPSIIRDMEGKKDLQSIKGFIELDTRDRRFIPHKGYRLRLSEEYTGGFLSSDYDFTKTFLTAENHHPLLEVSDDKKVILNLGAKLGQIEHFGDSETIPFFERFYAGGFGSVRGFRYRTISPKAGIDDMQIGGKIMAVFNGELTYPLYTEEMAGRPMEIIRLATFYDAANVVDNWDKLNWETTRTAFGYGLRFQIGMIPVSLDIGYPIKKQPGDETQRIQFNFGFGF
jgi:outer membrane protein assembly complex protein YaeT